MTRRVRLGKDGALFAVWDVATGLYLAGLLSEANRAEYLARNGWEVVG